MAPRIDSRLLLVGSLPVGSTEEALRTAAPLFGDVTFALPDGEPGERRMWVGYERHRLLRPHPDLELVRGPGSADGIPRHVYDVPVLQLRPGVTETKFDRWPRIDEALASYQLFASLRDEGVIPAHLRFQVCLPFPASAISSSIRVSFAADYPVLSEAYEELVGRELARLLEAVPAEDLAIQWDVGFETLDLEGVLPWTDDGAWERFVGPVRRLSPLVPEEVRLGYHLCYGTFPQWPMFEAQSLQLAVDMANAAVAESARPVDWLHLAGPRHLRSEEDAFFRPLASLRPGDARVFLGLIQPVDGVDGLRRRAATARRHLEDFGVAMYCGFGRQPGQDGAATMREHRQVLDALPETGRTGDRTGREGRS